MSANWKVWTWPRQIRGLKRALHVANEDKAHLIKIAGVQQKQIERLLDAREAEGMLRTALENQVIEANKNHRQHRNQHL